MRACEETAASISGRPKIASIIESTNERILFSTSMAVAPFISTMFSKIRKVARARLAHFAADFFLDDDNAVVEAADDNREGLRLEKTAVRETKIIFAAKRAK